MVLTLLTVLSAEGVARLSCYFSFVYVSALDRVGFSVMSCNKEIGYYIR